MGRAPGRARGRRQRQRVGRHLANGVGQRRGQGAQPLVNAYNHRQQAYVHHVPIAADLADFELATSLAASAEPGVLDRLATIAANARALAAEYTYEAEVARVGRELDAVWGAGAARAAAVP